MASNINDLTINYQEDGIQIIKELDKAVLSKGSWATVIYKYQQWNPAQKQYGPPLFTIRRYKKRNNEYKQQSKFNISGIEQAKKIITVLNGWIQQNPQNNNSFLPEEHS
jgi:hypothetical protein